jgi:hypothetical protein
MNGISSISKNNSKNKSIIIYRYIYIILKMTEIMVEHPSNPIITTINLIITSDDVIITDDTSFFPESYPHLLK